MCIIVVKCVTEIVAPSNESFDCMNAAVFSEPGNVHNRMQVLEIDENYQTGAQHALGEHTTQLKTKQRNDLVKPISDCRKCRSVSLGTTSFMWPSHEMAR